VDRPGWDSVLWEYRLSRQLFQNPTLAIASITNMNCTIHTRLGSGAEVDSGLLTGSSGRMKAQ